MTPTYSLVITIADADIASLTAARSRIMVAKPAGNATPNAVWLSCDPARSNTISWSESYGVYVADVPDRAGAHIDVRAQVYPASDRALYLFRGDHFDRPQDAPRVPRHHFDVRNLTERAVSAGLVQSATVNGKRIRGPLNATILPAGFTADFITSAMLYVWVEAETEAGSFAPDVPSDATVIAFDSQHMHASYRYDGALGTFAPHANASNDLDAFLRQRRPPMLRLA